jgi:alkylation response protein AidB-like acyl-CoA dehydrogenase
VCLEDEARQPEQYAFHARLRDFARSALDQAMAYLRDRRAFGAPLSEQQGLRFMLAEMARDVEAARALTRQAAAAKDRGDA